MGSRMSQIDVLAWVASITALGCAIYAATRREWTAVVALLAGLVGLDPIFYAAVGMALAAAFLNAAFNFCLGCEMYLRINKLQRSSSRVTPAEDQVPVA